MNFGRKLIAIFATCLTGWCFSYLAIYIYRDYAWGLFIWLPIVMGSISTILFAYKNDEVTKSDCRSVSFIALGIFCFGLLGFAFEGLICVFMAAPLGFFFNWIGHLIGYEIVKKKKTPGFHSASILVLVLSVPALMSFEASLKDYQTIYAVTSSIEINASPDKVWENVIAFPQLDNPTELIFKTGIAYPINAQITGQGVGAVRHCNFSTGSFVEPITAWDKPKLLKFDVVNQPESMKELSPYNIHPNHLHGYFVSMQGQFKLTALKNGHTLLEGTTWYYNKIKPEFYWTIWSNFIIHKIHERVLLHIKKQVEKNFN